jgi:hypothetical protein
MDNVVASAAGVLATLCATASSTAGHVGVDDTTAYEVAQTIDDGLAYGAQAPRTIRDPTAG